jgi:TolA-binding protein
MRKAVFLLLLALAAGLPAQEKGMEVSAPFVSRLKVKAGPDSVLLTWLDSPDVKGPRLVYRSLQELDEKSFSRAELIARLEPSINSYEDFPPDRRPYFYAVLLEDVQGRLRKLFIPFRNKTSVGVRIAGAGRPEIPSARIGALSAVVSGDQVRLSFKDSTGNRELLLFRSTTPIRSYENLLAAATRVSLNPGTTSYVDYPFPGLDYYYAVVDAGSFKSGKAALSPGQNSTTAPVQIPLSTGRAALPPIETAIPLPPSPAAPAEPAAAGSQPAVPAPAAAAPGAQPAAPPPAAAAAPAGSEEGRGTLPLLPLLELNFDLTKGGQLPPAPDFIAPQPSPAPLSPLTQRAVASILSTLPAAPPPSTPRPEPMALPEDQSTNGDEEADALQAILLERLLPGDFAAAETALKAFLAARHSAAAAARAHFYLGQVYYMQGKYKQASLELLQAQDRYYAAVQPWFDACLQAMKL